MTRYANRLITTCFACFCVTCQLLVAGPAEDLAARRAKLESMESGLSAWSYNSWAASFTERIDYYNGISPADTSADLRCHYVYDFWVGIEADHTLDVPADTFDGADYTRQLYPDSLILTLMDASAYNGGFSAAKGAFSNWTVVEYEAAADAVADVIIADPDTDGLQVDIEPMSQSWMPFMRRLSTRLHAAGKLCTLYILPGWTAAGDQPLSDANYVELFTICDSVAIDLYTETKRGLTSWQTWAANQMNRVVPLADSVNGNLVIGISSGTFVNESLAIASNYRDNASFAGLAIYDLTLNGLSNDNARRIHSWTSGQPEANQDKYGIVPDSVLNIPAPGILGNDYLNGGGSIVLVDTTSNGQLELNLSTGAFTYTPASGFAGIDSFTYRLDEEGYSSPTVTVTIEVSQLSGLVAYFSFDGHVRDVSGNGIYTKAYGNPGYTTGISGQAVNFTDVSDYITTAAPDIIGSWSASYWVKRGSSTGWAVLTGTGRQPSNGHYIFLQHWDGTDSCGVGKKGINDYTFNYVAPIGTWVNLVFVGRGTATDLYVNGVYRSSASKIDFPFASIGKLEESPIAALDEIAIWDRELTLTEIQNIYTKGASGEPFATLPALPDQVAPSTPVNGAANQRVNVDLIWQAAANADNYQVYVGPPGNLTLEGDVTSLLFDPAGLNFDQSYEWRIDAVNSDGKTAGEVWSFSTALGLDDTDGDGMIDLDEHTIGTNPYYANSKWKASVQAADSTEITISWPSIESKQYYVLYQTGLSGSWLVHSTVSATPPVNSVTIPMDQERCFFKIQVAE